MHNVVKLLKAEQWKIGAERWKVGLSVIQFVKPGAERC